MRSPALTKLHNRESQRRARSRQKEYIRSLEERLLTHETTAVQTSIRIQTAAREVAEENRRLRELLARKGVSEEEMERWLRAGQEQRTRSVGDGYIDAEAERPHPNASIDPRLHTLSPPSMPEEEDSSTSNSTGPSISTSATSTHTGNTTPPAQTQPLRDEIGCVEAAHIIAGMRGMTDPEEIWLELGCAEGRKCMVRNSVVLENGMRG